MKHTRSINKMTFVALLGAVSAVLMTFRISVPLVPSFLKFDISELPALFAGFLIGPIDGGMVVLIKILLQFMLQGTDTAFVGEFMNLCGSICFILPASLIYQRVHTKRGAAVSLAVSSILVSIIFVFINMYIAFPLYSRLYGMSLEAIIQMGAAVNPMIDDLFTLMLFSVFPFNLLKHGVTSFVTWLVYKKCANMLRGMLRLEKRKVAM